MKNLFGLLLALALAAGAATFVAPQSSAATPICRTTRAQLTS